MQLQALLPPPTDPHSASEDWKAHLPPALAQLPSDFEEFVTSYGLGVIDDFLHVFVPGAKNEYLNFEVQYVRLLAGLAETNKQLGGKTPFLPHPAPSGLVPWGLTDNGDQCFWKAVGADPDEWPIVICDGRMRDWEEYSGGFARFLIALLTREFESAVFPDEFPRESAAFVPI